MASVTALALASIAPGATASASSKAGKKASSSKVIGGKVDVDRKATLEYWTEARRKSAIDVDIVQAGTPHTQAVREVSHGKPGKVAGGRPDGSSLATKITRPGASPAAYTYPFPYSSWNVKPNVYKKWPYSVNGKIFFTNNGGNYVCSGTVVASYNGVQNEVWTAGHCLVNTVTNNQVVDSYLEFIPAYNGNKTGKAQHPYGIFTWTGGWYTTSAWFNSRDFSQDEAAILLNTNSKGQTLGNLTGWAGFAWNQSTDQQFVAFGWPADPPYNGTVQVVDIGSSAVLDSGSRPSPIGIGNPMTGGSSGGAWFIGWNEYDTGYINGHNDYKYGSQPLAMYSPYQNSTSNLVRCFGAASC